MSFEDEIGCPTKFFKKLRGSNVLKDHEKCIMYIPKETMFKFADAISEGECYMVLCDVSVKVTASTVSNRKVKEIRVKEE
jgi:hypothetical protein